MAAEAAWCREAVGLDYWQAWAIVLGFSALAGAWIRALDRRLAPGFARCGGGGEAWRASRRPVMMA